jgi:hypothetical protein
MVEGVEAIVRILQITDVISNCFEGFRPHPEGSDVPSCRTHQRG